MDALIFIVRIIAGTIAVGFSVFLVFAMLTHKSRMAAFERQQEAWHRHAEEHRLQRKREFEKELRAQQKAMGWDRPVELRLIETAMAAMTPEKWQQTLALAGFPSDTPMTVLGDVYRLAEHDEAFRADIRKLLALKGSHPADKREDKPAPTIDLEEVAP